ncbi:hypothetical protein [Streptomyces sp. TRM68367]|uniref:hypothetical protein n=1 Tax=Streptomyces sp. TRM68367 TaxID=2758415 RepID=UPI00165A75BB|nr:hypothetical protein [Streptomyces sp. TRM68367]MBC9724656.1 hypothetical protein [Streptomyces sp. TRM68367]
MRFHADLHIHSKYSRACSKDCDLEHLTWWARRKGITLVGTGDFTHPARYEHMRENLPGEDAETPVRERLAVRPTGSPPPRRTYAPPPTSSHRSPTAAART